MSKVSINTESVSIILKKLRLLSEEVAVLLNDTERSIDSAELEGWNDKTYLVFKEQFGDTSAQIKNALRRIDEEHIGFLMKIIRTAEEF